MFTSRSTVMFGLVVVLGVFACCARRHESGRRTVVERGSSARSVGPDKDPRSKNGGEVAVIATSTIRGGTTARDIGSQPAAQVAVVSKADGGDGVLVEGNRKDEGVMPAELAAASAQFKARFELRRGAVKKIMPHITPGMSGQDIVNMLGQPDKKAPTVWRYALWWSESLEIHFGPDGRVAKVGPVGLAEKE